jgi:hypothetical protein
MLQYARCCARMISIMARKRIGTVLEEKGLINEFQLVAALSHQRKWKIKLGKSLMELGYLEEGDLYEVLAEQLGMDLIDLKKREIPPEVLGLLSREQGRAYLTVPVEQEGDTLVMAVAEPDRPELQEELEKITGQSVRLVLATESDINAKIRKLPEKVSVATVQPVKKAFRRNQEGDIQPIEEEPVEPGPLPQDQMLSAEVPEIPGESGEEKIEAVPVEATESEELPSIVPEPVEDEISSSQAEEPEEPPEVSAPDEVSAPEEVSPAEPEPGSLPAEEPEAPPEVPAPEEVSASEEPPPVEPESAPPQEIASPEEKITEETPPTPLEPASSVEVPPLKPSETLGGEKLSSEEVPPLDTSFPEQVEELKPQDLEAPPNSTGPGGPRPSMEDFFPGQTRTMEEAPEPEEEIEEVTLKDMEEPVPLESAEDEKPVEFEAVPGLVSEESPGTGLEFQEEVKKAYEKMEDQAATLKDLNQLCIRIEQLENNMEKVIQEITELKGMLSSKKKD